jgi:hypothetical protein
MQPNLEAMSLQDLSFMLVNKIIELSSLVEQNPDGNKIRDLKLQVEKIRDTLKSKRSKTNNLSLYN